MTGFFVELNLHKTKWLLFCIYDPHKKYISDFLQEFRKTPDVFSLKYSRILIIGDFNGETHGCDVILWTLWFEEQPTCFKNPENRSCIDLLLTSKSHSFCNIYLIGTGLSDFHKMTLAVFKGKFAKCKSKFVTCRDFKNFF